MRPVWRGVEPLNPGRVDATAADAADQAVELRSRQSGWSLQNRRAWDCEHDDGVTGADALCVVHPYQPGDKSV